MALHRYGDFRVEVFRNRSTYVRPFQGHLFFGVIRKPLRAFILQTSTAFKVSR